MATKVGPTIAKALAALEKAIEVTAAHVAAVQEESPGVVRRLSPQAFVISSSTMLASRDWTVFYHDWPSQYRDVAELLSSRKFGHVRSILASGGYNRTAGGTTKFAPEVVERIRAIVGELPQVSLFKDKP